MDVLNQDSLDSKLVINDIKLKNGDDLLDKVVIKGSESKLNTVATVKALVDIKNLEKQEVGTIILNNVALRAYDEKGNVVDVEIVPANLRAEIEIASPSKELPIKVIPKGEVAFGKAISAISTSSTKVTVYGTDAALAELQYLPVYVDVNGLKTSHEYKEELQKPAGIKSLSVNSITVNVSLDDVSNRTVENVGIVYRNVNEKYNALAISVQDTSVSVELKGVKSVIDQISANDIIAYLDLSGYSEGIHEIEVKVDKTDVKVEYIPKTIKVKVKLTAK